MKMQTITLLSGSMNPNSITRKSLKVIEKALQSKNIETHFVCPREYPLPIYDFTQEEPENTKLIKKWISESDGLIVGSPEYHGGYTGVIKNILDHLTIEDLSRKPVGLLAASGGMKSGISTLNSLRVVFRSLHCPVIVEQTAVSEGEIGDDGRLSNSSQEQILSVARGMILELKNRIHV
jgi:azobenzene reductase